jgi:hypothetical protein
MSYSKCLNFHKINPIDQEKIAAYDFDQLAQSSDYVHG